MIRILATSDLHGAVYPISYADSSPKNLGMAKLKTLIDSLRDEHTILIDNGDVLEGSPLSFYHYHYHPLELSPMTLAMNDMHYDYLNLGNHDFNYGEEALQKHLSHLDAVCLTSNVLMYDAPLGPKYVIRQMDGVKLALFAVDTSYIPHWEQPEHIAHCSFPDAFESAKQCVEAIQSNEHPDYIIGIYHGGFERDLDTWELTEEDTGENQGCRMLKEIEGIDVLITGHQHRSIARMVNGIAVTQTHDSGSELACIEIDPLTHTITPSLIQADTDADQHLMSLCDNEEAACQKWLDSPLGTSKIDLRITDEFDARLHKSQVITFLNRVAMDESGAQLSASALFLGATGFRPSITMRDLVSTYVYPNTLTVKRVSGKVLKEYLEKDAEYFSIENGTIAVNPSYALPKPQHYNYDMVDGIDYTIKVSNPVGSRITRLEYQGAPVTDDMSFTLCLNNYRAAGGGNFNMIKDAPTEKEIPSGMVELMADWILAHQTIDFKPVNNVCVEI